jgi:hypothetical protein
LDVGFVPRWFDPGDVVDASSESSRTSAGLIDLGEVVLVSDSPDSIRGFLSRSRAE